MSEIKWMKVILAVLMIATLVVGIRAFTSTETAQPEESTLEKIERTGKLTVCYIEWPPTVIKDPKTGELSGHFVDMAVYMAGAMDTELEFQESSWGTFPADLNSGRCDLSIAGTFSTIPRAKAVAFSTPISYIGNGAVIKKDSEFEGYSSVDEFDKEGITIAVLNGEQGHEYVKQNFKNAEIKVLQGSDLTLPLVEVATGRADIGLADSITTTRFAENQPEVVDLFASNPYNVNPIAWAVRYEDQEWLQFINTAIDYMDSTGKTREFEERYDVKWLRPKKEWSVE
ncbi:transporter substrate-binding domain-containing protein [Candidatus Micrarchaeota archaeon]|nr:transporter substrate-binding domain-containing protein [Candidatus Micrarchaeota archaeon]